MARGGTYLRNSSKLNAIFGVGAILLLISFVLMLADDHIREWKSYQREFARMETEQAQGKLDKAKSKVDHHKLDELKKDIKKAKKELKEEDEEVGTVKKELKALEAKRYKANQSFQFARSRYAVAKYEYEDAKAHHKDDKAAQAEKVVLKEDAIIAQHKEDVEQFDIEIKSKKEELQQFTAKKETLIKKKEALTKGVKRLEKNLAKVKPGLINWLLNLPMLDFIEPTRKVQQVVVEDLTEDYHFAQVPRVDRCMTCHLGIDSNKWKDAPQPFKSHPKLDLFVASDSSHPVDKFGCTVCHNGSGQSITFYDAAHTPRSEEQKKEWQKKYNWKPQIYVEENMLPANLVEASCYQCHNADGKKVDIPKAPNLNAGKELFEERSCYACHAVKGYENFEKKGPDLTRLASKTSQEWTEKWLKSPRTFRPDTKMPQFFDLSNTSSEEDKQKSLAEIEGITQYLYKKSKPFKKMAKSMPEGNAEKGKELVDNRGCLGCHSVGEWKEPEHGPSLNGIGSKVEPKWLYSWVKNPKHYWKETRMPSLRLSDQEAADMTAYLMTLKNKEFDQMPAPKATESAMDKMALEYLTSQYGAVIGLRKFEKMSDQEKQVYVGERAINHYGCAGCHAIEGFEKAGKIGVELNGIGSRNIHTFEFGNVHDIDHTKQDWLQAKLSNPRVFDKGKIKNRLEKSKMPHFGFTDKEAEQLSTFLLGLRKSEIPADKRDNLDAREEAVEKGRQMVRDLNCAGCHQIEGKGGEIAKTLPEGMNPPPLIKEGEKVWGDWLHSFLKKPSTVRHWLDVRMPTYGFSNKEATALVHYFESLDKQKLNYRGKEDQIPKPSKAEWQAGKEIFETFKCLQCHVAGDIGNRNPAELAPELSLAHDRLKPRWVIKWLVNPDKYYPGTRMPGYWPDLQSPLPDVLGGSAKKQIKALRGYILNLDLYEKD